MLVRTRCWRNPNTLLADAQEPCFDVKKDNLSLEFPKATSLDAIAALINEIDPNEVRPIPNIEAMENLKYSECLSSELAVEVFTSRLRLANAVRKRPG
jgi:hypothetical protein